MARWLQISKSKDEFCIDEIHVRWNHNIPTGTNTLPEAMLCYHQWGHMAFILVLFHRKSLIYQYNVINMCWILPIHIYSLSHIHQGLETELMTPGSCSSNFRSVIFTPIFQIDIMSTFWEITLIWMLQNPLITSGNGLFNSPLLHQPCTAVAGLSVISIQFVYATLSMA